MENKLQATYIYAIEAFCHRQLHNEDGATDDMVSFIDEDGTQIIDPFYECSGVFRVDPIEEYGVAAIVEYLEDYCKKVVDKRFASMLY